MNARRNGFEPIDLARLGDGMADVVVVMDASGTICWLNRAGEELFGRPWQEWIGQSGLELVHPDDLALALVRLERVLGADIGLPVELRLASQQGWRLMEILGSRLDASHIILTMRDLTERRRFEIAGDDVARFRAIVQHGAALTVLLQRDGTVVAASGAITRALGHDPQAVERRPFADVVVPDDQQIVVDALAEAEAASSQPGGGAVTVQVRLCTRNGGDVPYELTIVSLLHDPTVEGLVVSGHDITRLRIAQQALEELASFDPITGLLNRRSFDEALAREWKMTQRDGIDTVVAVIDLNGFKEVNDRLGHAAGDDALRQVALALHEVVRDTDVVARLGGDEFGVLLVRCGGDIAAVGFTARLEDELRRRPWPRDLAITAAVGHESLRRASSPADALHAADLRMYDHKPARRA